MSKYSLEFILHTQGASIQTIKNSLAEFGDGLVVSDYQDTFDSGNNFKVNINTEDPTVIFDVCAQLGRIRSVKVNELR
jgi:dihydroxyacetone kinase-like predicted kinase